MSDAKFGIIQKIGVLSKPNSDWRRTSICPSAPPPNLKDLGRKGGGCHDAGYFGSG